MVPTFMHMCHFMRSVSWIVSGLSANCQWLLSWLLHVFCYQLWVQKNFGRGKSNHYWSLTSNDLYLQCCMAINSVCAHFFTFALMTPRAFSKTVCIFFYKLTASSFVYCSLDTVCFLPNYYSTSCPKWRECHTYQWHHNKSQLATSVPVGGPRTHHVQCDGHTHHW